MALMWRTKRQLFFLAIFLALAALLIWGSIYWLLPVSSCFDKKQNQGEESTDCGGPCEECVKNAQDLVTLWTRFFEIAPGQYEVLSSVENPNSFFGARQVLYRFRLYDSKNVLMVVRDGRTFVNPGETFLLYEPDVATLKRVPARATVEFEKILWERTNAARPGVLVTNKSFENAPNGLVKATFKNEGIFSVNNIEVAAVLYDAGGNTVGASISRLENLEGEGERDVYFTWRKPFNPAPSRIEILARMNLFDIR